MISRTSDSANTRRVVLVVLETIDLHPGRPIVSVAVTNTGDRPIQVGSHYHFAEANRALRFDRIAAFGHRLAIPAGTAVRFEPGESREVDLVPFAGALGTAVYDNRAHVFTAEQLAVYEVEAAATHDSSVTRLPYQSLVLTPLLWQFAGHTHTDRHDAAGHGSR